MRKRIAFFIFFISVGATVMRVAAQDCSVLFRQAYEKMRALRMSGSESMAVTYSVNVAARSGESHSERIEVKAHDKKSRIVSREITLYQDQHALVAIQHGSKSIFITKPIPEQMRQNQFNDLLKLQDTVFRHMTIKNCAAEKVSGFDRPLSKVNFNLEKKLSERLGIKSVIYWMDAATIEVKKVRIDYAESNPMVRSLEYSIEEMDLSYRQAPFAGSAVSVVMEGGKLKEKYKNYAVTDKRK